MAHGDYHCCALCDSKMDYSNDARTKEDLCSHCTKSLVEAGIHVFDGDDLLRAINNEIEQGTGREFTDKLKTLGYSKCVYTNELDKAFVLAQV